DGGTRRAAGSTTRAAGCLTTGFEGPGVDIRRDRIGVTSATSAEALRFGREARFWLHCRSSHSVRSSWEAQTVGCSQLGQKDVSAAILASQWAHGTFFSRGMLFAPRDVPSPRHHGFKRETIVRAS